MRFWERKGRELESELRANRPEPQREFARSLAERIGDARPVRIGGLRIALAAGLTALFVVALASVGGVSYAREGATQAIDLARTAAQGSGPKQAGNGPGQGQYFGARCGQEDPKKPPDPQKRARCPVQAGDKKDKEGNSGTTPFVFTISIAGGNVPIVPVSVGYVTQNGTATAGSDYQATAGVVVFAAGETVKTVTVQVIGDTVREPDEVFYLNLVNPSANAEIVDPQGVGTISNDDKR